MAEKKTRPSDYRNNQPDAIFAECRLNKADKDAFLNWMSGAMPPLEEARMKVLNDLWAISEKVDVNNNCYQCSWRMQDFKDKNKNIILVSRSDDPTEAFYMNVFKVYVLYEGQRLPTQDAGGYLWG